MLVALGAIALACFAAEAPTPAATPLLSPPPNYPRDEVTLSRGRTLFTQLCAGCHVLDRDGIGPPLGGVTRVLTQAELLRHVRDPAAVIASGHPRAIALFRRYKVVMPPFAALPEDQLVAILAHIDHETVKSKLAPFAVDLTLPTGKEVRLAPPVEKSSLVIELEDWVQIPLAPNRRPDKGIATLRSSPRKDGAVFISDQMGVIYRVKDRQPAVFLDIRDRFPAFVFEPGIATGLGSFAFHPDFLRNGLFYTTHAEITPNQPAINDAWYEKVVIPNFVTPPLYWIVTEWQASDPTADRFAGTRREVLRLKTPTTAHGCQDIAFAPVTDRNDPDYGLLFIGVGDGGSVNLKMPELSHTPRSLLGTLLRIDPRGINAPAGGYGIPADNPFAQSADPLARPEIWAYGFRNPHRMCWDLSYGKRLIVADIGESNAEEINLIEKGGDYGWNKIEGLARVDVMKDAKIVQPATPAELTPYRLPFGTYDHTDGKAISGGFVYTGPIEALRHQYIFGDIVTARLFFMRMGEKLSDAKIYELNVEREGTATSIATLSRTKRAHLRIGYDEQTGDLFFMTKEDGRVRRVTKAFTR
ncbi:MAG: PQQ-dependent sugar dehydrogenase [Opitutaceae bacterium]|nr:PQQ-dependent sugar dehydrogenase [Opitutaceae bacterium]